MKSDTNPHERIFKSMNLGADCSLYDYRFVI